MKTRLISAAVAAVIAAWVPSVWAADEQLVILPGVLNGDGEQSGVITTGLGILTVGDGQNVNSLAINANAIATTDGDDQASVNFAGNSTVSGIVGPGGSRLLNFDAGANASTVNFNGLVNTTTFNVSGTGTINFNDNVIGAGNFANDGFIDLGAGLTLTGAIITATAGTGTLTLNNGSSVTGAIGGASGLRQINVVGGNVSVTGAVQSAGFDLGTNTLNIDGVLTTNAGATIATTLAGNAVFGNILAGTSLINAGGVTVIPTVTGVLTTGTNFRIVDAPAGTIGAPVTVINSNPLYTFSSVPTTTGDVNIQVGLVPLATPAANVGGAVLGITALGGSDLLTVQEAIVALPDAAAINSALSQLAPSATNLAAPWVAGQGTRLFEDLWMARVEEVQDVCCTTCEPNQSGAPVATHQCKGTEQRSNWWGKGFGSSGRQDDDHGMDGYQTRTYGAMLAYDVPLNDETRVGLGAGYANTDIDGNHSNGNTDVDSYQLTGYISHTPGPWFVQGALMAGLDRYDGSRSIAFPGINRKAKADYRGQQYSGLVMAGRHFNFSQVTVTPLASLRVSRINVDSYTEKGAGDVNLHVKSQDYDFVQSGLGVKAESVIQSGSSTYSPEVHFKWLHDFNSTTMEQDVAFVGGGAMVEAKGIKQDRDMYNVGAGLTFLSCNCDRDSWTVKGLYDYKWNESDYSAHQLSVMANFKF